MTSTNTHEMSSSIVYDLQRLRILRELSLRGTLAAVAQALGYSPSAISHQLSVLTREVGAELLEPFGRGVRLTPLAHSLVARTESILRELEMAEADVAASRADVGGIVRIATFQTVAHTLIPEALSRIREAHPQLDVTFAHVNAEAAIPGLIAREFDVVISERYPGEPPRVTPGVVTETLLVDPLVVAIPEDWQAEALEQLSGSPWILEHEGTSARAWTDRLCRGAGFEPRAVTVSADVYLHVRLIALGLGVGVVPKLAIGNGPCLRLLETGQARLIEMSLRAGSEKTPAIRAVQQAVRVSADDGSARHTTR